MQEHPLIELYVDLTNSQLNTSIEEQLASVDLDNIVLRTLASAAINQPVMLTLLITDDKGISDMNQEYRAINKPTDVLSFPLLEEPLVHAPADQLWSPPSQDGNAEVGDQAVPRPAFINPPGTITNLGDIVMSWPTLVRQAQDAGHDAVTELLYLLSHGVLHLIGYDDHTEAGYEAMVHIQRSVLQAHGYKV